MRWANGKMYLSDTYYAKAKANLWPLNWIEIDLLLRQTEVARCLLPYTIFCLCFSAAVGACDAKKYTTLFVAWQASDRRQTTRPTCHGNLWARRQLPINYVHEHGKTTASSVRQRETETKRGTERGRQRWIKRSKLQTAWKETNRMSHVDLNNWSLIWIIATPRAACPSRSIAAASLWHLGAHAVSTCASRLKMESPHRRIHRRTHGLW